LVVSKTPVKKKEPPAKMGRVINLFILEKDTTIREKDT